MSVNRLLLDRQDTARRVALSRNVLHQIDFLHSLTRLASLTQRQYQDIKTPGLYRKQQIRHPPQDDCFQYFCTTQIPAFNVRPLRKQILSVYSYWCRPKGFRGGFPCKIIEHSKFGIPMSSAQPPDRASQDSLIQTHLQSPPENPGGCPVTAASKRKSCKIFALSYISFACEYITTC